MRIEPKNVVEIALGFAFFAALVVGGIDMAIPLSPLFALLLWVPTAVVCALCGGFKRGARSGRVLGWALVSIVAAWIVSAAIAMRQESDTKGVADSLVAAIEQYQANHGGPPSSLDALVPTYFGSVPITRLGLSGTSFHYHSRPNGFKLSYSLPYFMSRTYDSADPQWKTRD